ncbi:IclR family transcriptional regulator [Shinella sp.]|jgi:DNA-binding IclR family transcriptional regulator|uniref:IclR family transcriptional regulator n=1 Tax=Shinella sp. TaxID=1870904 RepID=UPI0028AF49CC|nr:IclR family transcriptional regulator [Shinella sp.]
MSKSDASAPKSIAPALTRGLKLLEFIARSDERQTLTDIAKELGIAMSSAHSLCKTLQADGYIERFSDGSFDLTLKVLDLASSKINKYDIVQHFYDICDEIPLIRENAAVISVLDGGDVFYIGVRNSPQPLGVTFKVGMRLPACCTATGRAFLAAMTDREVKALYPAERLPQVTKASTETRTELLSILAEARRNGYAVEKGGTRPHMYSYGVRLTSSVGRSTASVAVMLYESDATPEVEIKAVAAVKELATRLSRFGQIVA